MPKSAWVVRNRPHAASTDVPLQFCMLLLHTVLRIHVCSGSQATAEFVWDQQNSLSRKGPPFQGLGIHAILLLAPAALSKPSARRSLDPGRCCRRISVAAEHRRRKMLPLKSPEAYSLQNGRSTFFYGSIYNPKANPKHESLADPKPTRDQRVHTRTHPQPSVLETRDPCRETQHAARKTSF